MRFGRRNNGATTRPAPQPGLGFECDKFDAAAFDAHFDAYVGKLLEKVGPRNRRPRLDHAAHRQLGNGSAELDAQTFARSFAAAAATILCRFFPPIPAGSSAALR